MKITEQQYIDAYQPLGAWILVKKHILPETTPGGIIIARSTANKEAKVSMTGEVVAKSSFPTFSDLLDQDMMNSVQIGDIIGFSATTPMLSPMPPDIGFQGENLFVTMHVGDVLSKLDMAKLAEVK